MQPEAHSHVALTVISAYPALTDLQSYCTSSVHTSISNCWLSCCHATLLCFDIHAKEIWWGAPLCIVLLLRDGPQGDNTSWGLSYVSPSIPPASSQHTSTTCETANATFQVAAWRSCYCVL